MKQLEAYPSAQFVHSSLKFPTTRNGEEIMANDDYKSRIELVEGPAFPSLEEEYGDILEFYGFNQFLIYDDKKATFTAKDKNSPVKGRIFTLMKQFSKVENTERFLAIWFYHKPSQELVIEHNFDMCCSKAQIKEAKAMMMRMMTKPNQFRSHAFSDMPCAPSEKEACKAHCQQMEPILKLDVLGILDYHTDLGMHIRTYNSKEEFVEDFTKVLKKTGEDDPSGETLYANKNKKGGCTIM